MKKTILLAAALLVAAPVLATGNNNNDKNAEANAGAEANALGLGVGVGVGIGKGGDAQAGAVALGGKADSDANAAVLGSGNSSNHIGVGVTDIDHTAQGQEQGQLQGQSLDNAVDTNVKNVVGQGQSLDNANAAKSNQGQSLNYEDSSKFLSLALPGATADHGSTAECLDSRRGWTFAGFGASGRTRTNEECDLDRTDRREFKQCYDLASAYAALGDVESARAQLAACGGVGTLTPVVVPVVPECPVDERLDRVFEACQSK